MKLFSFIKNFFRRKSTEAAKAVNHPITSENIVPTYDVFGGEINAHDYLVPVEYVDVRRRGYLTIKHDFDVYRPDELKNTDIKKVMRLSTLEFYMNFDRVSISRRRGFMHVHCKVQAFKNKEK